MAEPSAVVPVSRGIPVVTPRPQGDEIIVPVPQAPVLIIPASGGGGVPGPPGPPGPQGPPGPAGPPTVVAYTYVQGTPAAVWTIPHNLEFFPNVTVFDSTDRNVEGDAEHLDVNTMRVTFSGAFSGVAYLS